MMTYSQYYAQYVKDHEKELNVLITTCPTGSQDTQTTEEIVDVK